MIHGKNKEGRKGGVARRSVMMQVDTNCLGDDQVAISCPNSRGNNRLF